VLPLVEPDGPVIGSFAACLELIGVKVACFFPDRRAFPREMLAMISVSTEAEKLRQGKRALQAGAQVQNPVRTALGRPTKFSRGFSFTPT